MKHLLLILSFLLLSSPVIGEETGVLYQYETSTGIKWKTFGDGKVQPKYESVSQCFIQTMKERELTGNKMFEMVKEECERILGKVETGVKKLPLMEVSM